MKLKAPWQWVASPLSFNMLLSMLKENSPTVEKYTQIAKTIEKSEGFKLRNRIFVSSTIDTSKFEKLTDFEIGDFSKNKNTFSVYMNKYGDFKYHEFSSKTELIYINVCTFESPWQLNKHSGLSMKLYNSFNYADDVRYEGRLMELPLSSKDFKLVLVLPNEGDVLENSLFVTLTNQGLAAAIGSIQPLFTANTALSTPISIAVKSRVEIQEKINTKISNGLFTQYGTVAVSDEGTRVKVLTCLYLPSNTVTNNVSEHGTLKTATPLPSKSQPFYFAVVYQDMPIFYGDFKRQIGTQNV